MPGLNLDGLTKLIVTALAVVGLFFGSVSALAIYSGYQDKEFAQYNLDRLALTQPQGLYLSEVDQEESWFGEGYRYLVYKIQDERFLSGSDFDPALFHQQSLASERERELIAGAENKFPDLKQYTRDPSFVSCYKTHISAESEWAGGDDAVVLYSKEKQLYVVIAFIW